ncbi:hypothetical protein [Solobacterium sp.]|uniref:hypothetical protein n=1 Tax=Solobacterium sp. TaxID=2060878 RepID=UPI001CAADCD3|nr:hypothetical protein [Solobacterium sp.]MBF1085731.1 hypothetical protein [Solobacterium sp.]
MKNKDKYDLRDISYAIELNDGGYEFVVYYTTYIEIHREIFHGFISIHDTFTKWLEEESPSILTDEEKAYLSAVIKPFRKRVECVRKMVLKKEEFLKIYLEDETILFPFFAKGTMYKGMEAYKEYTLEELGL